MKNIIKKVTVAATLLGTLATAGSALAATQYPGGGVWTYGAGGGGAYSNYYHGKWNHSRQLLAVGIVPTLIKPTLVQEEPHGLGFAQVWVSRLHSTTIIKML